MSKECTDIHFSNEIVKQLFDEQYDFVILGLCGKTGSGVTTSAKILEESFEKWHLDKPGHTERNVKEAQEYRILYNYAEKNWKSYSRISTKALITRYILGKSKDEFIKFIEGLGVIDKIDQNTKDAIDKFYNSEMEFKKSDVLFQGKNSVEDYIRDIKSTEQWDKLIKGKMNKYIKIKKSSNQDSILIKNTELAKLFDKFKDFREKKKNFKYPILYLILKKYLFDFLINQVNEMWSDFNRGKQGLSTLVLQSLGINLRISGKDCFIRRKDKFFSESGFYTLANDINNTIKVFRSCIFGFHIEQKTLIVIDSIKNPYESMYLKNRYSNYYLIGIYTNEEERKRRLRESKHLSNDDIKNIDTIEENSSFKRKIKLKILNNAKGNKIKDEGIIFKTSQERKKEVNIVGHLLNNLEKLNLLDDLEIISPFIMQNVSECLERADIFINT